MELLYRVFFKYYIVYLLLNYKIDTSILNYELIRFMILKISRLAWHLLFNAIWADLKCFSVTRRSATKRN